MHRKFAAIGFAVLVIVFAVVLILVSRLWKQTAPAAIAVTRPCVAGECEAAGPGDLPDLNGMRRSVGDHASDVKDALSAIED